MRWYECPCILQTGQAQRAELTIRDLCISGGGQLNLRVLGRSYQHAGITPLAIMDINVRTAAQWHLQVPHAPLGLAGIQGCSH